MDEKMTLELAMRRAYALGQTYCQQADSESYSQNKKADETTAKFNTLLRETLAAQLAQPAQAVDVVAIREVIRALRSEGRDHADAWADKLTRAIGNAQAEGWSVPSGWKLVPLKPTQEMLDKGTDEHQCEQGDPYYSAPLLSEGDAIAIYTAMLANSPTPTHPGHHQCP